MAAVEGRLSTLAGVLRPVFGEGFENISGLVLSTADDQTYELEAGARTSSMLELCREAVKVLGRVRVVERKKVVDVLEFVAAVGLGDEDLGD